MSLVDKTVRMKLYGEERKFLVLEELMPAKICEYFPEYDQMVSPTLTYLITAEERTGNVVVLMTSGKRPANLELSALNERDVLLDILEAGL